MLRKREEELRSKRFASKKDRKITLDFAGRQVIEEHSDVNMYDVNDEVVQQVQYGTKPSEQEFVHKEEDFDSLIGNVNPNIKLLLRFCKNNFMKSGQSKLDLSSDM
jgi:hypothetical protein